MLLMARKTCEMFKNLTGKWATPARTDTEDILCQVIIVHDGLLDTLTDQSRL